jgi:hypothetical protein
VKLHADVTVELSFDVVSENPIEPSAEEKAAEEKKSRKVEAAEVGSRPPPTISEACPDWDSRPTHLNGRREEHHPAADPPRQRPAAGCRTASRPRNTCSPAA